MKKLIVIIFLSIGVIFAQAQDDNKQFIHKGILRATGIISPGMMLKENISTISLHGNLEYYIENNISMRGDIFYFLKAKDNNGNNPFNFNHSLFTGASYHFKTKNHFDPYFAFQPGIAYANNNSTTQISPLVSSVLGFNYYFERWFHLFIEGRYINGKNISEAGVISLSELRFSFGLGFNLSVIKAKN